MTAKVTLLSTSGMEVSSDSIYRFMSFESFVDTIQRKELALIHPEKWEDPYEGFVFKSVFTSIARLAYALGITIRKFSIE